MPLQYCYQVWSILFWGWVTLYLVRVGLSPALVPIMEEFQLSHSQAGALATAIFWAYTFLQVPAGHLGDRWGRKVVLFVGTVGWSLTSLLTGLTRSFQSLFLLRLLTGFFEAGYFGNDRSLISAFTPKEKMALGHGISAVGMGVGMGFGVMAGGIISQEFRGRYLFILFSMSQLQNSATIGS